MPRRCSSRAAGALALGAVLSLAAAPPPGSEAGVLALDLAAAPLPKPTEPRPRSIAILVLSESAAGYPISEVYGAIRRPLEAHTALRVAPLEAIGIDERDAAIRACAGDAACFVRRLDATRGEVDLLLAVSVDRPGEDLLLGLRLIDTRRRAQIGATGDEIPAGMSLEGAFERRLPDVVPASVWGQVSGIQIASEPASAEATLAGRSCVTPCGFDRLAPGTYELEVRTSGRDLWREPVRLEAGRTATVRVMLEAPERPLLESPWLWTAVGIGLAAGAVGGYFLLQDPERETVLCFSPDAAACDNI